jgi:adenylosuccinate synthase
VRLNGLDEVALTKLDVLSGIDTLRIAVAYTRDGERIEHFPAEFGVDALTGWEPVYEEMSGWAEDISGVRTRDGLPAAARAYVARTEQQLGVPITLIGVGPDREQAVV